MLIWIVQKEVRDRAYRADDIGDVRHGGSWRRSQVHDLGTGFDVDLIDSSQNGGCQFGAERVPGPVLDLGLSVLEQTRICV